MPTLKQLDCSIELGPSNIKLKEYSHRYTDGCVETFVAVPNTTLPFSIHLTSRGYIAPGLAVFVYMDGMYQTNRNRLGLKMPGDGVQAKDYEIDFRLKQKEEKTQSKRFIGRDWTFKELNTSTLTLEPIKSSELTCCSKRRSRAKCQPQLLQQRWHD